MQGFSCAHEGFTRAVSNGRTGLLLTGNVSSGCMRGAYISADPAGCTRDLAAFDHLLKRPTLVTVAALVAYHGESILYAIFHHEQRKRVVHGAFLTDTRHRLLWKTSLGPTWKSDAALDATIAYLTEPVSAHEALARIAATARKEFA